MTGRGCRAIGRKSSKEDGGLGGKGNYKQLVGGLTNGATGGGRGGGCVESHG